MVDNLDRALARLANLARDDHEQDRSMSVEDHYTRRLDRAIERQRTRYTYLQRAKSTITILLIHRAKLRLLLEAIVSEVLHNNNEVVEIVAELLAEIEKRGATSLTQSLTGWKNGNRGGRRGTMAFMYGEMHLRMYVTIQSDLLLLLLMLAANETQTPYVQLRFTMREVFLYRPAHLDCQAKAHVPERELSIEHVKRRLTTG